MHCWRIKSCPTKSTLSLLGSARYALIKPKRASSGALGTASAGKLVIVIEEDMWFAMFCSLCKGEEEEDDEGEDVEVVEVGAEAEAENVEGEVVRFLALDDMISASDSRRFPQARPLFRQVQGSWNSGTARRLDI
jgi:hypothetical protein